MKKLITFLLLSASSFMVHAATLGNVVSQQVNGSQAISFNFDTAAANPIIMASGNDLIVDFANSGNATAQNQYNFTGGYVNQVTLAASSDKLRAVIANGALYKYNIVQNGTSTTINFNNQNAKSTLTKKSVGVVYPKNNSNVAATNVTNVKFSRDDKGGGIVEIAYSGDAQIRVKDQRVGDKLVLQLNEVSFDNSVVKRLDVSDFASPIKYIDTQAGNSNQLNVSILNRGNWDYALYQLQNKLIINIRQANADGTAKDNIPSLNQGKSDKISLNFQNIDVRALLQLLADFSGYNILVSDSVSGTISLKLNDVPWDQALQIILNSKGLGMRRDGNIIRIAPVSELSALSKLQQDSQRAQEAIEPIDSLTVRLKYSQAAAVQGMLQQSASVNQMNNQQAAAGANTPAVNPGAAGQMVNTTAGAPAANTTNTQNGTDTMVNGSPSASMLSSRGSILVDTRTNTLIINDTPSRLKDIKELIDKIDIPVKQVLIEARIVEASSNFERDLGTRLLVAGINGNVTFSNSLSNAVKINQGNIGAINQNPSSFVNSDYGFGPGNFSAIYSPNSNTLLGLEIDAKELQSEARTISSPKVITSNYQPANIQQGVQIPYQQASSAGNTNVAFVNATLSLDVTPQITDDGNIMMNVNVQKNQPNVSTTLSSQGTPAIDTSSVQTNVLVQDGSTILVGGIFVDQQSNAVDQIPGLGDIPVLGWLFKTQRLVNTKRELLIFITPRIINNDADVR